MNNLIISIDGPAGCGKQKIAKYIAKKYKFFHLDSGILYRRIAYLLLKKNINPKNINEVKKFIYLLDNLSSRNHSYLRSEIISKKSSHIATYSFIRNFVNKYQKIIVNKKLKTFKGCVIDGRDIGSKVFKEAKIKLFIKVNIEIRAKRRHKQLIEIGEKSIYAQILKEMKLRDKLDKDRTISPLVIPRGAFIIDNSYNFNKTTIIINNLLRKIK